jgi:uncharacterized protein with PQ loop repeat
MDTFVGYEYSWAGFTDYSNCYHEVKPLWIVIGATITLGTVVSVIPQLAKFIKNRSSYGLNSFTITATSLGQFVNVLNYVALHAADFVGIITHPITVSLPRLLSFINLFTLWYMFLGNTFLNFIFFDKKPRERRNKDDIKANYKVNLIFSLGLNITTFILINLFIIFGMVFGFNEGFLRKYGYILGTSGGVLAFAQYVPQMYTTCKLQDPGSLSLILLAIQAPGGTINTLFLAIGNKDNWTTWLPLLVGASQQFILLFICIFFMCKNRKSKVKSGALNGNALLSSDKESMATFTN